MAHICPFTPHMVQTGTELPPMSVRKNYTFPWLKLSTYKAMSVSGLPFKALVNDTEKQQRFRATYHSLGNETDTKVGHSVAFARTSTASRRRSTIFKFHAFCIMTINVQHWLAQQFVHKTWILRFLCQSSELNRWGTEVRVGTGYRP